MSTKKIIFIMLALAATFFTSCSDEDSASGSEGLQKSIVILYDNDVHCAIDGYTKMAGLRDAIMQRDTVWTGIVSCGDFLQGGTPGALSRGKYIVDIMRNVGYDAIALGNHEFDYGLVHLKELMEEMNTPVLCTNYYDTGSTTPYFASYTIHRYGGKRVAFVGVLTPETMIDEGYSFFDEEGDQLADLRPNDVCELVQTAVDAARSEGADYVVTLSHLGEAKPALGISSHELIAATRGIDVVLDGHTHSAIPHDEVANLDGKMIPISQTGTGFANVGKLVITTDGHITTTLIPTKDITFENMHVSTTVDSVRKEMEKVIARPICHSDFDLIITDANGVRQVRRSETNLGDLVTDAFREAMQAEIGLYTGGGIRSNIAAGTITYGDVTNVLPFDNYMMMIEATGAEILTVLERCTAALPAEEGQFPQVSGLRYTIHQQSHTVSDVSVLDKETSTWLPIDTKRLYTIAVPDYYKGGAFFDLLKDCRLLSFLPTLTRDILAIFMEGSLGGIIPDIYAQPQGRIIIEDN